MKVDTFPYAFFEGKMTKIEDAKVSIMTNALQYGTAFFGGIRGYKSSNGKFISLFRLSDHYNRLLASKNVLGVEIPYSKEELIKITLDLIAKNKPKADIYLRPYAYA